MATYIYQLSDGTEGILPNLFVEKSKVISEMLSTLGSQDNKIPMVNEKLTKDRLEKICDMLHFFNMEEKIKRGEKELEYSEKFNHFTPFLVFDRRKTTGHFEAEIKRTGMV